MPNSKKYIRDRGTWLQGLAVVIVSCLMSMVLDGALGSSGAANEPPLPAGRTSVSVVPSEPVKGA